VTGEEVCSLIEPSSGGIYAVAWSPDGNRISSGGIMGVVVIYDSTPGRAVEKRQRRAKPEQAAFGKLNAQASH